MACFASESLRWGGAKTRGPTQGSYLYLHHGIAFRNEVAVHPWDFGMPECNLDNVFWDNLLDRIEHREVIPVLGPGVITYRPHDPDCFTRNWRAGWRLSSNLSIFSTRDRRISTR